MTFIPRLKILLIEIFIHRLAVFSSMREITGPFESHFVKDASRLRKP
jgi:hypothetical protein